MVYVDGEQAETSVYRSDRCGRRQQHLRQPLPSHTQSHIATHRQESNKTSKTIQASEYIERIKKALREAAFSIKIPRLRIQSAQVRSLISRASSVLKRPIYDWTIVHFLRLRPSLASSVRQWRPEY